MSTSVEKRKQMSVLQREIFKVNPVAVGCTLLMIASGAYAQQAPASPQTLDTVTVTGIRRGIEAAISVKKNSDSIVEAISAEDIGKLPDNSIAESIARLPGLAAQRVNGRAQEVQIRGLSGQFATTLLNGREQVSTGDNRSAEFDQYPSELLSGVVIYKTPDGSLVGQGLSGTIDLQTVKPLAFGKRTMAVNLRGEKNSLGKLNAGGASDTGNRFSFSYIDQFADRTIGVAIGYAHLDSPNQSQYYRSWGYPQGNGEINGVKYNDVRLPGGVQIRAESATQKRDGLMGVLQWKPSADFESNVDAYHSKFKRMTLQRGFEAGLAWSGATLKNPVVEGATSTGTNTFTGGVLTQADYVGVKPVFRHDLNDREDSLSSIGWNNKLNMGAWTGVADLAWSKAKRNESILEMYAGTGQGGAGATDTFGVVLPQGGGFPSIKSGLNYADPSLIKLVDSGGWGQAGYLKTPEVRDEIKSLRLSAKRDLEFGMFSGVDVGMNVTKREKSRDVAEWFLDLKASPTTVPASMITGSTNLGFVGMGDILGYDGRAAQNQFYKLRSNINNHDIINKAWTVNEEITTAYGKLDIDSSLFGLKLRGNLGVQAVHSDQKSTATSIEAGANRQQTQGTTYTDYLPSMNLSLALTSDQNLRFALAKQSTRPRMDDLRSTQSYSINTDQYNPVTGKGAKWEGNGGNSFLKPWEANAVDISWEKYFGNTKGYVSVAGFYKDLSTYIYSSKVPTNFKDKFGAGLVVPAGRPTPDSDTGDFTQMINGTGGSLQGLELALSLPLQIVTPMLDGFGVQFSYAYTDSKIQPFGPGDTRPLPGLSKNTYNLTGYYEKNGFSARVSTRIRDAYVGEITGFGADRTFTYGQKETITDMQVGYEFQSGMAKGVSVLLQVNNLGNEAYTEYYDADPTRTRQVSNYGRTYLFGVNYKF
ncbi:TonB-dependent receptor [Roseateles oligotrophus]|uniref:TonB-dependent receptor n=1 Tax=Roseateles oligotrophus TaxID=1769250 RepID=A0ABT2YLU0_9BURK|nr:TonB-dependent receptor [Roseateles oligotrophus]MCV2370855.1 TonB-dependent receptor [Roseateles oligotrophus]